MWVELRWLPCNMWVAYIFKLRHLVADIQSKKLQMMVGDEGITAVHQKYRKSFYGQWFLPWRSQKHQLQTTQPLLIMSPSSVTLVLLG